MTKSDKLQVWTKENSLASAITQRSQKSAVLQTSAGCLECKVKVQADAELTLTKTVISEAFFFFKEKKSRINNLSRLCTSHGPLSTTVFPSQA